MCNVKILKSERDNMKVQSLRVVILAVVSFVMAALRTVIITFCMEKNEMADETYYLSEKPEVTVFAVISVLLVLLFAVFAFLSDRKKKIDLDHSFGSVPAGSLIVSFSLMFAAFIYAMSVYSSENISFTAIGLGVFIFTVLSAVKFFYSGLFYYSKHSANIQAFVSLAPIFLAAFRLLGDFIRKSTAPFASSGAYQLVGLVAVMLFFLLEGKSYTSPTSASLYYFFGYASVLLLLVYSLPNLILHCFGSFTFNYYTAYSVVDLGTAVYIATRLSSAKFSKPLEAA